MIQLIKCDHVGVAEHNGSVPQDTTGLKGQEVETLSESGH